MIQRIFTIVLVIVTGLVNSCYRESLYDNSLKLSPLSFFNLNPSSGPSVVNVTSTTADGTYAAGVTIDINVIFSDIVYVNTAGSIPSIALNTATVGATASYNGGSGTNTLNFNFSTAAGQNSADLDYASTSSLKLNGATIRDASGNNAKLRLFTPGGGVPGAGSLAVNKNIVINTSVPAVNFVAVGTSGLIITSSDPSSGWSFMTSGTSNSLSAVASNGSNVFLAVGDSGVLCYSTDGGATWAAMTNSVILTTDLYGVTYGGGFWVAVGAGGKKYYSSDVASNVWTADWSATENLNGVTFGNGYFIAVGNTGAAYRSAGMSSPAGTWGALSGLPSMTFNGVAYGNGEFVVLGATLSDPNQLRYSTDDGTTWTDGHIKSMLQPYYGACYGNSYWVVAGYNYIDFASGSIAGLTDGGVPNGTGQFNAVAYGNGYFVVVGNGGMVWYASDPSAYANWIQNAYGAANWKGIAYGN
jgi:hypothetical protein